MNNWFGVEALQTVFPYEQVEPHEEEVSRFVNSKPMQRNADGSIKEPSGPTSDNFVEMSVKEDGSTKYDIYVNSPYGTFVTFHHALGKASEADEVNIFLASSIYSEDARLILGSMHRCSAKIKVHVGYITGFYGACLVAEADEAIVSDVSAIGVTNPVEYFSLRGLRNEAQQLSYIRNSITVFTDTLIQSGLLTQEEIDSVFQNKQIMLKREDLASRLNR